MAKKWRGKLKYQTKKFTRTQNFIVIILKRAYMEDILKNILDRFGTLIPIPEWLQNRRKERMEQRKAGIFNHNNKF